MPREVVSRPVTVYMKDGWPVEDPKTNDEAEGLETFPTPVLEFNWSKATEDTPGFAQASMQLSSNLVRAKAAQFEDETIVSTWVFTEGLSRDQLNNIIRVVRRMRDAVYGSDE